MTRYVLRRAFHSVGVALTVLVLVFFVGRMIGDPAVLILPVDARAEQVEELRQRLGLNAPISTQFLTFVTGAVRGDFGVSFWQQVPALGLVFERLPSTLLLAAATMAISTRPTTARATSTPCSAHTSSTSTASERKVYKCVKPQCDLTTPTSLYFGSKPSSGDSPGHSCRILSGRPTA